MNKSAAYTHNLRALIDKEGRSMSELEKLKYWLDSELTLMHIGFYVLFGIVLNTKKWWIVMVALIFISLIYMLKRVIVLARDDKDYLNVKKSKGQL